MQFERSSTVKLAVGVGIGAVGAYLLYRYLKSGTVRRVREGDWVQVGTISEICVYPIKSCKGHFVREVSCVSVGLKSGEYFDRQFVIGDQNGNFIKAKEEPKLLLIEAKFDNGILILSAPEKEPIRVNFAKIIDYKTCKIVRMKRMESLIDALDCGDDVANWLNEFLTRDDNPNPKYRLMYYTPGLFNGRRLDVYEKFRGMLGERKDTTMFADLTSSMLMTETSMEDLNSRVPSGEHFSMWNFRPNFVVTGTKEPYDEDKWAKVRIGKDTVFTNVKACTRCIVTTMNWETGEKHPQTEPLRTLRKYRIAKEPEEKKYYGDSPMLGINLAIDQIGMVRLGDPVWAVYKKGLFR